MSGFYLRQATASQTRLIGPYIDDTDFKSPETGLTIANTDLKLSKNGASSVNKNSGGGTHDVNGYYSVTFDATDTATVGPLKVSSLVSGAMLVEDEFWVLEEAIYDALFGSGATGLLPANVTQWLGTAPGALTDTDKLQVSVQHMGTDVLEAGNIADNAFSAEHFASAFLTADKIATDAITDNKLAASAVVKIWSQLTSGLSAVTGSFGKLILDNLNATVSSRATPTNVSDAQTAIINAVNAVNTGAARYISIHTNAAYEIPDSGSVAYPIEIRTFDADGEPAAIDAGADPTVTVTRTTDSADLSGNLAAFSSPATAVYRTTLTITQGTDSVAPLRIDASGAIATVTRSTSAYPVITDAVAVDFTATDRANLALILENTGTTLPQQITLAQNDLDILTGDDGAILATVQDNYAPAQAGDQMDLVDAPNATAVTAIQNGLALATKLLNYVRLLARKDSAVATDLATELGEINADTGTGTGAYSNNDALESIRDNASGLDAAGVRAAVGLAAANLDTQLGAIAGDTGSGANSITPTVTDGTDPLESAKVRFTKGAESYLQSTNASGTFSTPFALDNGTWTVTITLPGYTFSTTTLVVTGNATPTYAMTATGLSVPESPRIRARLLVLDATTKLGLPDISLTVTVAGAAAAAGYGSRVTSRTITSDANGLAEWYALPGEDYTVTGPSGTEYTIRIPSTATDPHNLTSILI